ncbi:MAG: hypothetical protein R6X20_06620 [Phycisphaerae bacterium]
MDAPDDPHAGAEAASNAPAAPSAAASAGAHAKPKPKPSALVLAVIVFFIIMSARIYDLGLWRPVLLLHGLFYGGLTSVPIAALCLVPQLPVPRRFKSGGLRRVVAFTLPAVVLAMLMVWHGLPSTVLGNMLGNEHFAALPPSASDVKVEGWTTGFCYEVWLRFTASPEDVEAFLAASPELRDVEPEHFNRDRMLLLRPRGQASDADLDADGPHAFAQRSPFAPSWYAPEIREKGRVYSSPSGYNVIVNDATHTVFIYNAD